MGGGGGVADWVAGRFGVSFQFLPNETLLCPTSGPNNKTPSWTYIL